LERKQNLIHKHPITATKLVMSLIDPTCQTISADRSVWNQRNYITFTFLHTIEKPNIQQSQRGSCNLIQTTHTKEFFANANTFVQCW